MRLLHVTSLDKKYVQESETGTCGFEKEKCKNHQDKCTFTAILKY